MVAYILAEGWTDAESSKPAPSGDVINSFYGDEYVRTITEEIDADDADSAPEPKPPGYGSGT